LLAAGAYTYLIKPFNIKELLQNIEKVLNQAEVKCDE